ncbi:hypothetical protein [Planomicrobium sp. CPCC 101079]|uniref:hypothetical protein n=1 Tax=Planomicrobium sp. CPCC 101079 TaxID=2599618 RepID=UPI0016455174|nr:hypothetical protein [Planomicrobium sp. CPCC 101079]
MEKKTYIALKELSDLHEKKPGLFPVFSRITKIDGQLVGEVKSYSDEYGKPVQIEKMYH